MKKILAYLLAVAMALSLCSCNGNDSSQPDTLGQSGTSSSAAVSGKNTTDASGTENSKTEQLSYPYVDTEGRTRYQLYINEKLVETQHDPYTYASEANGAYYPIVEIFKQLGVECLFDESAGTLTTKINGTIITCSTGNKDITVGKKTLSGTAPEYVEDCFFVPSYTFMELLDAVVDFNSDRSGVTITTDMSIDKETSGTQGLSISAKSAEKIGEKKYTGTEACALCGGTGKSFCARCSGTGSVTQYMQKRDPITGQMTIISTKVFCSSCSGGRTVCHGCGGSGKR